MQIIVQIFEALFALLMQLLGLSSTSETRQVAPPEPDPVPPVAEPEPEPEDEDEDEDVDESMEWEDPAVQQAAADAAMAAIQAEMDEALGAQPELLEPIDGVDVETWARIAAFLATNSGDVQGYHRLLAEHGLDAAQYEAAQDGWTERMQNTEDPMAAAAVSKIYGEAFLQARPTQASQSAMQAIERSDDAPADAPCSLDRYAELVGAQGAWAEDGLDVNAMLSETFGMTAADYADVGAYWSARMMSDIQLAGTFGERMEAHKERYRSTSDADADLVL